MIKSIIFDLDGTILDTIYDLNAALNHTFAEFNLPKVSVDKTRANLGNGIKRLISDSLNSDTNTSIDILFNSFMEYYYNNVDVYTKPFEGIPSLLLYLKEKGFKLAVISNKNIKPLSLLINNHYPNIFDAVYGDGMGYKRKPDHEVVLKCLEELKTKPDEAIYIGDSDIDVITVKNVSCHGVFVSYGYRKKELLEENGAKIICDSVKELKEYLSNFNCN